MAPKFQFNKYNISIKAIKEGISTIREQCDDLSEIKGLFIVRSGNSWLAYASKREIPKKLFDVLWYEGELCILFADTNLGKSILAVQIAESISKGQAIIGFQLEAPKQKVLYFDFELSDKQFENRYSNSYTMHHSFDDNFIRVEINPDADIPEGMTFEEFLIKSIEKSIIETGAKILIVDNLTYLSSETEKAKDALPLMKLLKALKTKYGLSILCLAHTPKRDLTKPITRNDLQGSKMLINFCDSAFTIGESYTDKNIRYLKQIKQRNTEQIYNTDNVCICQIDKPFNFLQFEFIGYGKESAHLRQLTDKDKDMLEQNILALHQEGKSLREIGSELGISHMKAGRVIKKNSNS